MPQQPNSARPASVAGAARMVILALAIASPALCAQPANIVDTPVSAAQSSLHAFDIPAQALDDALLVFARQAGVEVAMGDASLAEKRSTALHGRFPLEQGLQQLLAGTDMGFYLQPTGANSLGIRIYAPGDDEPGLAKLAPVVVKGNVELDRDTAGYDAVYDENYSSVYAGKEQIERYKGSSPADLFKGMANVYSGDARNSGAVDPNIRGIQGPGRIALTVDGTEQALTVWRGYSGVNNRNYIDPNLIGGIQVIKGHNLVRNVKSGIGGAVVVKTLEASDVLKDGEAFGGEVKLEGSNNTVKEKIGQSYVGQDYRDVADQTGQLLPTIPNYDPYLFRPTKDKSDSDLSKLQDFSGRIAFATQQEKFDLLGAYAYRSKGNYFSGRNGVDFYKSLTPSEPRDFTPYIANNYIPGGEVPNTSSEMESWLLKGTLKISDAQSLSAIYRDSKHIYGEIMPSRITWGRQLGREDNFFPQWPLSEVDAKTYSLEYKLKPLNNRWVDLYANIWMTDTDSDTYSSGGFPHVVYGGNRDPSYDAGRGRRDYPTRDHTILDTANTIASHSRKGVTISNKINLLDTLDLTLGADLQREKLSTEDEYFDEYGFAGNNWRMLPRSGRRQEHEFNFNFDWRPTSRISVSIGARSLSYWIFDDFRDRMVKSGDTAFAKRQKTYYSARYHIKTDSLTQEQQDLYVEGKLALEKIEFLANGNTEDDWAILEPLNRDWHLNSAVLGQAYPNLQIQTAWRPDEKGRYSVVENPFLNGQIDLPSLIEQGVATTSPATGQYFSKTVQTYSVDNPPHKERDHGSWVPALSVAFDLTPGSRLYLNYSEALRMPSMFEGTAGFSAALASQELEPEHSHIYEIAYTYNISNLPGNGYAYLKVAYFHNNIKNVIERNPKLQFSNIEKQTISGWEFQSRYDNGKVFADLSLVYNQKNEVCDESTAVELIGDSVYLSPDRFKKCTEAGFPMGYLTTMILPKYSGNLSFGSRFFNEKFEIGSRLTYHYKQTHDIDEIFVPVSGQFFNVPLSWDTLFLLDAYADLKVTEGVSLSLVGTNLTNQYYLDPLSRSAMPAPGRTFKLALTANF